ncbi:ImmA/IrrE family metallo-endopeptidase [Roseicyclus sp.]
MQLREYFPYDVRDVMRALPPDGDMRHKFRRFTLNPRVDNRARSVAAFAKDVGFGVEIEQLPRGMNGKLQSDPWSDTGKRIVVSSRISREAQRFTVLHEMGHHFRHGEDDNPFADDFFDVSGSNVFYVDESKEREAHEFAEALLFGGAQLTAAVGLHGNNLPALARYFGVTERVVSIALNKLRY